MKKQLLVDRCMQQIHRTHLLLLIAQVVFTAFCYFEIEIEHVLHPHPALNIAFGILVPLLTLAMVMAVRILAQTKLKSIQSTSSIEKKVKLYSQMLMVTYGVVSGTILFVLLAFCVTQHWFFFVAALAVVVFFAMMYPTRKKMYADLALSRTERQILERLYTMPGASSARQSSF
ncbi:MAG: hypothetical protein KatS3mg033_1067 [Thermonema sp.]|uniref:hypothetical protein n=1 Tax=Thermonema sp. TaxID=2231181 RepID=UPI0021DD8084|nr:hypothetical protein [Thermonema sp.]GIV39267.1 MAG: hypothetical protein KatS3mg033_1067 [Thermonema sp.]